jgi:hypothetical protein
MATIRPILDPITNKSYDYTTTTAREEHLLEVLDAATTNQCPTDNEDYLCDREDAIESKELVQCAECYKQWADKVGGADSPKAQRLLQAIDLASHDKCPHDRKDMVCQATEDEDTSEEVCAMCIKRWATIPFAHFRK